MVVNFANTALRIKATLQDISRECTRPLSPFISKMLKWNKKYHLLFLNQYLHFLGTIKK